MFLRVDRDDGKEGKGEKGGAVERSGVLVVITESRENERAR